MTIKLKNNATGLLATSISASDTGLVLQAGNGAAFSALGAGEYFYATLVSAGGTLEIVKVTARVGDTMTVVRAQEGTSAAGFAAGSRLEQRVTAQSVLDVVDQVTASQVGFTPYGWIGATDAQAAFQEVVDDLGASAGSSRVGFLQAGTNAVATTVQAKLRERVSAADFGITPNAGDQIAGLLNLRSYLIANNDKPFSVFFAPGTYQYTNNRWLLGVRDIEIDGYGVFFQNISTSGISPFGIDAAPLKVVDPFYAAYDQDQTGYGTAATFNPGYKINSAVAGAATITLKTPADSSNFSGVKWVLVHGYDQQFGGYPPNMRYFEYRQVVSINSGTGVITLDNPLSNSYDDEWYDFKDYAAPLGTGFMGAARVLPIKNNYDAITEKLRIVGAGFLNNPNFPASGYSYFNVGGALVVELIDCDMRYLNSCNCTMNRIFRIQGGTYRGDFELDKLVEIFSVRGSTLDSELGSTFQGLSAATGVNLVDIQDTTLVKRIINLSPRNLVLANNDIDICVGTVSGPPYFGVVATYFDLYPISSVRIVGNRLRNFDNTASQLFRGKATSSSLTVIGISGDDILLNRDATTRTLLADIDIGTVLTRSDGVVGGVVTRIYDNLTNIVLEGTWPTPSPSEVYLFTHIKNLDISGNTVVSGPRLSSRSNYPFYASNATKAAQKLTLTSTDLRSSTNTQQAVTFVSHCYVSRVVCHITRAFTGTYADKFIYVEDVSGSNRVAKIDATAIGSRYIDSFGQAVVGSDVFTSANLMKFIERLSIKIPRSSDRAEDAEFTIEVGIVPVLWS